MAAVDLTADFEACPAGPGTALERGAVPGADASTHASTAVAAPAPIQAARATASQELAEANQCCICSEPWHSSGPRRAVALTRCGHIFCRECILEWFKERGKGPKLCPTCRVVCKGGKKDVLKLIIHGLPLAGADVAQLQQAQDEKARLQKQVADLQAQMQKKEADWADKRRYASLLLSA